MSILSMLPFVETGMNLVKDVFGYEQTRKMNSMNYDQNLQNMQFQDKWNQRNFDLARSNIDLQREFAQKGISWRAADAKSAGIHPLAAMGANPMSFSPVSVGGQAVQSRFHPMGQKFSGFGNALQTQLMVLRLKQERARLDNMNLRNMGLLKQLEDSKELLTNQDGVIQGQNYIYETDLITGERNKYPSRGPYPKPKGFTYNKTKIPYSSQTGIQSGEDPLYKYGIDNQRGRHILLSDPNEEKLESMNLKQMVMDAIQAKRMIGGIYYKYAPSWLKPKHHEAEFRRKIKSLAPKKNIPGHKWVYDPWQDRFLPVKIK